MIVVAPISMPPVARATRCEEIRLSSIISTRMTLARSGIWSVMPSSFSTAEAVGGLLEQRREVVHAGAERHALGPGAELHVLLDAGVQVADARAGLGDRLAVDLEDQPEHAVRRRVLRAHVDDDPLLAEARRPRRRCRPSRRRTALKTRRPRRRARRSRRSRRRHRRAMASASAGCWCGSVISCTTSAGPAAGSVGALVLDRDAAEGVVLALRVAGPVVRHQDAGQGRVAVEDRSRTCPRSRARASRWPGRPRRSTGCAGRRPGPRPRARIRRPPWVIESRW